MHRHRITDDVLAVVDEDYSPRERKFIIGFTLLMVAVVLVAYIGWTVKRDEQLMKSMEAYEDCVREEYNTTPAAWYEENGEYPNCDPSL